MVMASDPLSEKLRQWALLKQASVDLSSRMNKLRDELMDTVDRDGDRDEKGSSHLRLTNELEVGGKFFRGLKREARTSTVLNEERALEMVVAKGLENDVVVNVPTIDLDALYEAYQQRKLTQGELDSLFDTRTSFAFKPVEE
ncbi:hypothetical protein [Streptomyces tubercidicus]|uniref:hypothetical protein n=1 Tax=Streptomyces tubercidicus TaxID=47759 RepID=UPI00369B9BC5